MVHIVTIEDVELAPSEEICECSVPVGHISADHHLLSTVTRVERRCSVCDQLWGEGAYSRHEHCVRLDAQGARHYADCAMIGITPGGPVDIRVT
jgi:hypothetical protein